MLIDKDVNIRYSLGSEPGNVRLTIKAGNVNRMQDLQVLPQLPFEIWVMYLENDQMSKGYLMVNPSLELAAYHALGPSSRKTQGIRLPVFPGKIELGGAYRGQEVVIWKPFVSLTDEVMARLDAERNLEHGLRLHINFQCGLMPLTNRHPTVTPLTYSFDHTISSSDWRQLLEMVGWPRPHLYEFHPLSFSDLSEFEMAKKKFKEAETLLLQGHYGRVVGVSRVVVESVFRQLGYKPPKMSYRKALTDAKSAGLPEGMAAVFRAFNDFTNSEHHPNDDDPRWDRATAIATLRLAALLAEYAGHLPKVDD